MLPSIALAAPTTVTLAGDVAGALSFDAADDKWQGVVSLAAGTYEYQVLVDATLYPPTPKSLQLLSTTSVKFYYDDASPMKWIGS